uniref:Uncharacterized protein n=1 Tax=Zea mays TaxID=4577 RepID=A0A804N3T5_MAIZE
MLPDPRQALATQRAPNPTPFPAATTASILFVVVAPSSQCRPIQPAPPSGRLASPRPCQPCHHSQRPPPPPGGRSQSASRLARLRPNASLQPLAVHKAWLPPWLVAQYAHYVASEKLAHAKKWVETHIEATKMNGFLLRRNWLP